MKPIIEVTKLSKSYQINHGPKASYATLKDELGRLLTKPIRRGPEYKKEEFWALKDVSFNIEEGDIVGVIGRNGAGKSTLLKLLSRITDPTSGEAVLRGRVSSLLEVGTGFHPELTGRDNVFLNGAILGMSRREIIRKFDEIVSFAEIEKFIDTPVKFYSSGMYTRLAFAVAANLEPDILIVDEVLSVGDLSFQKKSLGKMEEISNQGRTVLFVSHNIAAIQTLCKSGLLLDYGEVKSFGKISKVVEDYKDLLDLSTNKTSTNIRGIDIVGVGLVNPPKSYSNDSPLSAELILTTDRHLPNCYVNLIIEDAEGRIIIHSRTDVQGGNPKFSPGRHRIRVDIPRISLKVGVYSLWFRVVVESGDVSKIVDSDRVPFEVNGNPVSGILDVPSKWSWREE